MKKHYVGISLILFLSFLIMGLKGESPEERRAVDINTAITAASEYLLQWDEGKWLYYTHLIYYDLDNQPSAYAIVFRKEDSGSELWEELERRIERYFREITGITDNSSGHQRDERLQAASSKEKALIYGMNRFVTVLTGAVDTGPTILKCCKGLPRAFINKTKADCVLPGLFPGEEYTTGKIYFVNIFDIYYELLLTSDATRPGSSEALDSDGQVFCIKTNKRLLVSEIKDKLEERRLSRDVLGIDDYFQKNKRKWASLRKLVGLQKDNTHSRRYRKPQIQKLPEESIPTGIKEAVKEEKREH